MEDTEFVNEKKKSILWMKSVLKETTKQYKLLYAQTKKFKYDQKRAIKLQDYYRYKYSYTKKPKCEECKDRRVKLSKLKKDLADRMQRIEVTMNAKEDLLKKMRTLDPKIKELKLENASLEMTSLTLEEHPAYNTKRRKELRQVLYPGCFGGVSLTQIAKDEEEKRKEIEKQIRIETQEKKEIFDDLALLKRKFIDQEYPCKGFI